MSSTQECPPNGPEEKPVAPTGQSEQRIPWGFEWRSSIWFITLIVGIAITTDLLIYSMIVPIIPFRLQSLGYDGVSGLVGWLLFAYSAALVIFTAPIALLSEKYKNRKIPLICGEIALIGSQVLLMEAPTYWVMVIARIAQGISASVIWVVGLALICDSVPEKIVGKQLGLAMMGLSLGFLVGPPVAGALDKRFGFRGPFIFGIIVTVLELIGRLLIIERSAAERMDASITTLVGRNGSSAVVAYGATDEKREEQSTTVSTQAVPPDVEDIAESSSRVPSRTPTVTDARVQESENPVHLSLVGLLIKLFKSPRALAAAFLALSDGIIISGLEPVLPLYLQSTYGLDVSKIGLVYIAAIVPSFVSSPLAGWYADRGGAIISTFICFVGTFPFCFLLFVRSNLAYFISMYCLFSLFVAGSLSPITAEFASVTKSMEGVGYGHLYGAFNVAYGLGSALGPVIGGQLYDHLSPYEGWRALCIFFAALVLVSVVVTASYYGSPTYAHRAMEYIRKRRAARRGADDVAAVTAAVAS